MATKNEARKRIFYDDKEAMLNAYRLVSQIFPNSDPDILYADQLNWIDITGEQAISYLQDVDSKYPYSHIKAITILKGEKV